MTIYINDGRPVSVYHGITAAHPLRRCAQAAPEMLPGRTVLSCAKRAQHLGVVNDRTGPRQRKAP